MEQIKDTIQTVISRLRIGSEKNETSHVDNLLKQCLSPMELSHIRIKYFSKGSLGIEVDSSAMLYCLGLKKHELMTKMDKKIKKIKFFLGEF
jgi:hypothetical protein